MSWTPRIWLMLAALSGFIAVAAGAFGAHGVADPRAQDLLKTGAHYQLMHALATLACATLMSLGARQAGRAPAFFLSGTVFFAGSLYAMAAGAPRWFGAITPIGGVLFLIGWLLIAWAAFRIERPAS